MTFVVNWALKTNYLSTYTYTYIYLCQTYTPIPGIDKLDWKVNDTSMSQLYSNCAQVPKLLFSDLYKWFFSFVYMFICVYT